MKNLFLILATFTLLATISISCNKAKPLADFSFDGTTKKAPVNIQFTNTSTDATEYTWDFGDGVNSTEQNPKHQYANGGTFNVTLSAKNKKGKSNKITKTMTVLAKASNVVCSSITINNLSFSTGNNHVAYFYINGIEAGSVYSEYVNGTSYKFQFQSSITISVDNPVIVKVVNMEVLVGSTEETFSFTPTAFINPDLEENYPSKVNFTNGATNFDVNVDWQ